MYAANCPHPLVNTRQCSMEIFNISVLDPLSAPPDDQPKRQRILQEFKAISDALTQIIPQKDSTYSTMQVKTVSKPAIFSTFNANSRACLRTCVRARDFPLAELLFKRAFHAFNRFLWRMLKGLGSPFSNSGISSSRFWKNFAASLADGMV